VLSFGTSEQESRREYSETDIALVEEFARRVSTAIDNARLFRQADELNRLKDEFLATLSHELRTPLSAILGWSRMLAAKQLDDERAARAVEAIERNAQAQSQLVDDILDVARGMAGNLRLDVKPVDLVAVAHRGVEAIAPAAAAKRLDVNVTSAGPVSVLGDAGRLQQVVWNLLSNAVKFTGAGGHITLAIQSTNNHAELSVADTGIGIAPAFLPFVFDKFRQADGSYTRQHGGLGLGLAIARHLTELHWRIDRSPQRRRRTRRSVYGSVAARLVLALRPYGGVFPSTARSDSGSTRAPVARTAQCRCGPVTRPVAPTRPTMSPAATRSPSCTSNADRCASSENNPRP
jgi:signal transduction histidine kinase